MHFLGEQAGPTTVIRSRNEPIAVDPSSFSPPRLPFLVPGDAAMSKFVAAARRFIKDESGATMVEYGLMLALIAIVAMGGAAIIGTQAKTLFSNVGNTL
jgi:pilus assembly protein Flp/PilA